MAVTRYTAIYTDKYFTYMKLFNPLQQPSRQGNYLHFTVGETET